MFVCGLRREEGHGRVLCSLSLLPPLSKPQFPYLDVLLASISSVIHSFTKWLIYSFPAKLLGHVGADQDRIASGGLDADLGVRVCPPSRECSQGRTPRQEAFEMGFAMQIGVHKAGRILWVMGDFKEGGSWRSGALV